MTNAMEMTRMRLVDRQDVALSVHEDDVREALAALLFQQVAVLLALDLGGDVAEQHVVLGELHELVRQEGPALQSQARGSRRV